MFFSGKVTDVVETLNNFEQNLVHYLFCFSCSQFMGKDFKRHYIFGGNTDRGVIPSRQFVPNISLSIERSVIILLPSCLSRKDASK